MRRPPTRQAASDSPTPSSGAGRPRVRLQRPFVGIAACVVMALGGCAGTASKPLGTAAASPAGSLEARTSRAGSSPVLAPRSPGEELYELSPARIHIRRLAPQALRLLAPHWSRVRESDRRALQGTLVATLSETRVVPFAKARLEQAAAARPDLAARAIEWLKSPIGYEVKFSEATAWSGGDKASPEDTFYASVAAIRDNRTPEIRMQRLQALAAATGALEKTLDLTEEVGTVVARLVNVARPDTDPMPVAALDNLVDRERKVPAVSAAYTPVVTAALMVRCRDLALEDLDRYIEFASTEAGRWYHDALSNALVHAVEQASMDVEAVFHANAHSDQPVEEAQGFNLDALQVPLPSGRTVRLLALAQTGPAAQPAVILRYETSLPIQDSSAVRGEAGEVWEKLRAQIESEGAHAAVLQPTGSVDGWVFPFASSRKFAWKREAGGSWVAMHGGAGKAPLGQVEREMLWSVPP